MLVYIYIYRCIYCGEYIDYRTGILQFKKKKMWNINQVDRDFVPDVPFRFLLLSYIIHLTRNRLYRNMPILF